MKYLFHTDLVYETSVSKGNARGNQWHILKAEVCVQGNTFLFTRLEMEQITSLGLLNRRH